MRLDPCALAGRERKRAQRESERDRRKFLHACDFSGFQATRKRFTHVGEGNGTFLSPDSRNRETFGQWANERAPRRRTLYREARTRTMKRQTTVTPRDPAPTPGSSRKRRALQKWAPASPSCVEPAAGAPSRLIEAPGNTETINGGRDFIARIRRAKTRTRFRRAATSAPTHASV